MTTKADKLRGGSDLEHEESDDLAILSDTKKICRGILRHIPLIVISALGFAVLGGYMAHKMIGRYESQSVLIYQQAQPTKLEENFHMMHLSLPSAVEMVKLPTQLRAVKSILGLDYSVEQLEGMVTVELPSRRSNLINIKVTADDPDLSVDIANAVANVSVKKARELNRRQWQTAHAYFTSQAERLRRKLDKQILELGEFRKVHRFIGMDATGISSTQALRDSESRLQMAKLDYQQMLVEYENLKREFGKIPDKIERQSLEAETLQGRISQIETTLLDARTRYAPENPKIKALESQLKDLQHMVYNRDDSPRLKRYKVNPIKERLNLELINMQAKLRATMKLKEELESIVTESEERATNLSDEQLSFADMISQKDSIEKDIKLNEMTQRGLEVLLHIGKSDLEVYQLSENARESKASILGDLFPFLGFLLGALFGVTIAGFIEVSDRKIRTAKQVEGLYKKPCLISIPELKRLKPYAVDQRTLFYIRSLSDRIELLGSSYRSLAFISAEEREGKSFLAYQTALYYQKLGKRVVIVECDYRENPCFSENTKNLKKLELYLRGEVAFEEIVSFGTVDRIKAGNDLMMKELMKTDAMGQLRDRLESQYDVVIYDAPGMLEEEYGINVASLADATIYVIGSSKTDKVSIEASIEELDIYGINVLGVVLNRVHPIYLKNLQEKSMKKRHRRQKRRGLMNAIRGVRSKIEDTDA